MNDPLIAHYRTLARYNLWATQRLLTALHLVPDAHYYQNSGLFFTSIHGTLNHLLVGEHHIWYPRFAHHESPALALNLEIEPKRDLLAQQLLAGAARWRPFIDSIAPEHFSGRLNYRTTQGQAVSLPYAATLDHVFHHGTHHRGQISAALTAMGHAAPVMDLVYMLVEESQ